MKIKTGPLLAENANIAVYEHPTRGDEAPVIVHDKNGDEVFTDTPFHDADDLLEIEDWIVNSF